MSNFLRFFLVTVLLFPTTFVWSSPVPNISAYGPYGYKTEVKDNQITVCTTRAMTNDCPKRKDLLRQNVQTGEVVLLPRFCIEPSDAANGKQCYLDECVPKGTYRYGFAEPLACTSVGTNFFVVVTVETELNNCKRQFGNSGPTTTSQKVPWKEDIVVCRGSSGCGCQSVPSQSSKLVFYWPTIFFLLLLMKRSSSRSKSLNCS